MRFPRYKFVSDIVIESPDEAMRRMAKVPLSMISKRERASKRRELELTMAQVFPKEENSEIIHIIGPDAWAPPTGKYFILSKDGYGVRRRVSMRIHPRDIRREADRETIPTISHESLHYALERQGLKRASSALDRLPLRLASHGASGKFAHELGF